MKEGWGSGEEDEEGRMRGEEREMANVIDGRLWVEGKMAPLLTSTMTTRSTLEGRRWERRGGWVEDYEWGMKRGRCYWW